jgi:hypothetical protein
MRQRKLYPQSIFSLQQAVEKGQGGGALETVDVHLMARLCRLDRTVKIAVVDQGINRLACLPDASHQSQM